MVSDFVVKSEVTTEATWILDSTDRERIKNYSEGLLDLSQDEGETDPYLVPWISAIPQDDDYLRGTSRQAWVRGNATLRLCEVTSKGEDPISLRKCIATEPDFYHSNHPDRGWDKYLKLSKVLASLTKDDSLEIRIELTAPESLQVCGNSDPVNLVHFDRASSADIAFRFSVSDASPRYIFASKAILVAKSAYFETLFDSGFAETTDAASLNLEQVSSSSDKSFTFDKNKLRPFYTTTSHDIAETSNVNGAEQHSKSMEETTELEDGSSRPCKRQRTEAEGVEDEQKREKCIPFVDITERDFTTYRAMLAHLYTSIVPFTALPSDYLVARQEALDKLENSESLEFPSPKEWFLDQFEDLVDQRDWNGIEPCSPHAMFRLADCYGLEELRGLAKGRIERSLTVENVAYELFSPLSFDYDEIRDLAFEFFKKHWAEVKTTKALDIVLKKNSEGELPDAHELIKKILLEMDFAS
ncbi:hypothetical protein JCM5353_001005 [Sporobolomyces roseus]